MTIAAPETTVRGVSAHLLIETTAGEILVDEDVNKVEVGVYVRWANWPAGNRSQQVKHEVRMSEIARIELSMCRDRLKR